MSAATPPALRNNSDFDVVLPIPSAGPQPGTPLSALAPIDDGGSDDELSDEAIARLLREAELRMRNGTGGPSPALPATNTDRSSKSFRLPKLDPGASLPKPPISSNGSVSHISDRTMLVSRDDLKLANSARSVAANNKSSKEPPPTAGSAWYDMPRTVLTDEFKRDFTLIKHRNVLDPHRHYKKDSSGIPEYSQVGTVIEGNTEFYNSRINRRDRKKTILEEVMADGSSRQRFKRKYDEIQKSKKSGKKEFYKNLKAQRNKLAAKHGAAK